MKLSLLLNFVLFLSLGYIYNKYKPKTYVKTSNYGGRLGRGVFANKYYVVGDIIEEGHSIIQNNDDDILKCGIYNDYVYSRTDKGGVAFLLGNAGLYNHHSTNSNAVVRTEDNTFKIIAKKNIMKDEEIFTCYGCNHIDESLHYDYGKSHDINFVN
jgi:hypothetical protein